MPTLSYNPDPTRRVSVAEKQLEPGESIRDWVDRQFPATKEFPSTTVCLLNGKPLLREAWGLPLKEGDEVVFVSDPNDPVTLLWVTIGFVVGAVALFVLTPTPKIPGSIGDPDPVYSIRGQSNQNRFGSEIEVPYGKNRLWPSKAAREYTKFVDNEQEIYLLLSLGQGFYDLDNAVVQIEDTEISNFDDIQFEFYEPGETVTLFPDNVETSGEVSDIELFGPNEPEFDDWVGPFAANSTGTTATKLEVDLVFPQGLYFGNDDGGLDTVNVTASVEYREIDDAGSPVGAGTWSTLVSFSKTLGTNTPQRFTVSATVPAARYEVRAKRTNNVDVSDDAHRTVETLKWVALRAFRPSTKDYGDVTLLAIQARASNNLNGNSSNRVNVITTRKLPTWDGSAWTAPQTTRSLVWAFCDVLRANYSLRLGNTFIDLETLTALNTTFEAAGIYFDHVFDSKSNAWDWLTTIARAGNAVPVPNGTQISMVVDEEKTIPKGVFTKENILPGSFSVDYRLYTDDEFDGVEVEYTDPTTYEKETVLCLVGDDAGDNPEQVKLPGVMDRTRAWRVGMRLRESRKLRRTAVKFSSGKEAQIPNYNDLILVCHDVLDAGAQTGRVESISGTTITLDTELDWTASGTKQIAFRTIYGEELGPFAVTEGTSPNIVILGASLTAGELALIPSGDTKEKPVFAFGVATEYARKCRVVNIQISGEEEVEIEAVEDNPTVYSHDNENPPSYTEPTIPDRTPDLPSVTGLIVRDIPARTPFTQAVWNAALGAQSYVVEGSYNNVDWFRLGVTTAPITYLRFNANPGTFYVRVAAVNNGRGPWSTVWSGTIGDTAGIGTSGALIIPPSSQEADTATAQSLTYLTDNNYLTLP